jgi:glycosyltransferase involved in cell wall biosynthesis
MVNPRICIIRRAYYPAESHVRRNADSLITAGYSVLLICLRNKDERALEVVNGVNVYRLPLRAHRAGICWYLFEYIAFFLLAFAAVTWLHFRHPFIIVEADSMPDFLIFAGLIPRLTGSRLIIYLFESMPEIWAQKKNLPMTHRAIRFLQWQEKVSCAFADAIICCHGMARDALVGMKIPVSKITTILNVPDEDVFHRYEDEKTSKDGIFHLIQHGTMTENYGIQVVIEALSVLDPDLPVHYDVTGEGEFRPALEAMTRRSNLQDRVTFHGYITRERLLELILQSTAGVVPMLFEYQSPNKLFEFVALCKPVIASDRKTFKQHFTESEILYFKTGDAKDLARVIEEAFYQPENLKARVDRASRRYEEYRWTYMQKRYLDLYKRLEPGESHKLRPEQP